MYSFDLIFLQSPLSSILPLMVLGTVSVIGGLSVLMLPETGSHLSDTLEEVEECIAWVFTYWNGGSNLTFSNHHCVLF